MALQIRRGTNAQRQLMSGINTPAAGELLFVTDWATAGVGPVWIGDGTTAGGIEVSGGGGTTPTPTYLLSAPSLTVDEGDALTITLTTTNVTNGTTIPYTITGGTGFTAADIGLSVLTGNFNVSSNTASINLNIASDFLTEGPETFTLTLNSITPVAAITITVNDTVTAVISGGGPGDTVFDFIVGGGDPTTTLFDTIIDGGTPA